MNEPVVEVTDSLKVMVMLVSLATSVAPLAGPVLITDGAASATVVKLKR